MTDISFTVSAPYVRQITETGFEQGPDGHYTVPTEYPGFLELVVDVNGAPWVVARRKAPGLLADIERAKLTGPTTVEPEPAAPPPAA